MANPKQDFRTPLSRVNGLGSAKSGTEHFWHQRLTALANIPLGLFFVGLVVALHDQPFETVQASLASWPVALGLLALIGSGLIHMRLGMQVIIEDYVHTEFTKILCLVLNTFFVSAIGLGCVFSILKLAFAA
jgi:succinate dehydrogenase / fumarate reductase, membrane anchor subunit